MNTDLPTLDSLLHQPSRTQLVAFLSARGEATFAELKRALNITDGNLGAHLNKLLEAGYLRSGESLSGNRAQKVYALTPTGRTALAEYVGHLSALMALSGQTRVEPAGDETSVMPLPMPKASI